jgi:hypothetical protein
MAKKPEPPKPTSWSTYKIASKAVLLGEVEAPDLRLGGRCCPSATHSAKFAALRAQIPETSSDRSIVVHIT